MIYNGQVLRSLPVNLSKLVCKGKISEFAGKRRFKIDDFVGKCYFKIPRCHNSTRDYFYLKLLRGSVSQAIWHT